MAGLYFLCVILLLVHGGKVTGRIFSLHSLNFRLIVRKISAWDMWLHACL